jgi:hypothetical protein
VGDVARKWRHTGRAQWSLQVSVERKLLGGERLGDGRNWRHINGGVEKAAQALILLAKGRGLLKFGSSIPLLGTLRNADGARGCLSLVDV